MDTLAVEAFLKRMRELLDAEAYRYTAKAGVELLELELDEDMANDVLRDLTPQDFVERLQGRLGHQLQVFITDTMFGRLYIKLTIHDDTIEVVVVSFHPEGE